MNVRPKDRARFGAILDRRLEVLDITGASFDPSPWLGRPVIDLFAAEDRSRVGDALERLGTEGVVELSARLMLGSGPFACLVRVAAGSRFVHLTAEPPVLSKTLPERENRLEQLGLVASQVSHDLKNLLAAVLINAELIPRTASDPAGISEVSREIVVATERARELLEQILGYASASEEPLRMVDLNALTREMGRLLEVASPSTVVLRYDLQSGLPLVRAHAPQIRQMLMNFIVNAGDAIGESVGAITITTGIVTATAELLQRSRTPSVPAPGKYVCLQVQDTGPGLDSQTMHRVFDPFFTTKDKGHGLGLSACMTIVEEHGGALLLYSEPGQGATFQVLLPAVADARPEVDPASAADPVEHDLAGHVVLVIDDDALIRSVVRRTLTGHGLKVLTARDGLDGLDMFEQHHHELSCVLLDMGMPHVSGSDVFEDLRSTDPDVPVVFASGHGYAQLYAMDEVIRAEGLLLKPFRERELLDVLQRVSRHRRAKAIERAPSS